MRSPMLIPLEWFCVNSNILEFLDSGRKSWMLNSGCCTLDTGLWKLDSGLWMLDLNTRPWALDTGRWTFDAETVQRFGNNGAISITSFLNSKVIKIFGHFRYENFSNHLKISITRDFQMMRRGKVDLNLSQWDFFGS